MSNNKNIYQRVLAVMGEISYLKKDAKVMSYKAITHDKVVSSVRSHLIEHGIVIEQDLVHSEVLQGNKPIYSARYSISFVNVDNPEDRLTVHHDAHAVLTDDKSPGKTNSYALKNAILKTFMIETGENDEESNKVETVQSKPQTIKPLEQKVLKEIAQKMPGCETKFLEHYKISNFSELTQAQYPQALKQLEKRLKDYKEEK
jgi:hypothetical protein